jgi:phosphomevalonate kinase
MIRFQQGDWEACPPIEPLVIWSGAAARTGPRVDQYLAWTERQAFVDGSRELVEAFHQDPVAVLEAASDRLQSMALAAGVDYLNPALDRIQALARGLGGAAKPSGAGGGDSAIALLPDPDAERRFLTLIESEGLIHIPIEPARGAFRSEPAPLG